ncbi:MAG: hypothetical protein ACI9S9_005081 [Planctomycetota bacterium]|jgi:hypothetical protein
MPVPPKQPRVPPHRGGKAPWFDTYGAPITPTCIRRSAPDNNELLGTASEQAWASVLQSDRNRPWLPLLCLPHEDSSP